MLKEWHERFPFKCVFGFTGDINAKWAIELNALVKDDKEIKNYLPDWHNLEI